MAVLKTSCFSASIRLPKECIFSYIWVVLRLRGVGVGEIVDRTCAAGNTSLSFTVFYHNFINNIAVCSLKPNRNLQKGDGVRGEEIVITLHDKSLVHKTQNAQSSEP